MFSLEWAVLVFLGSLVLACASSIRFFRKHHNGISGVFLAIAGLAAIVVGVGGAVAEAPLMLPTSTLFNMTIAVDKFSSLFLIPFGVALLGFGTAELFRRNISRSIKVHVSITLGSVVMVLGASLGLVAGNIFGVLTGLGFMVLGGFWLGSLEPSKDVVRQGSHWFSKRLFGVTSIGMSLFLLSGGALFNDFATVSYIAAEIESFRIVLALVLMFVGAALFSGSGPKISRKLGDFEFHGHDTIQTFVRSLFFLVSIYLFLRNVLFIFPPIHAYLGLAIVVVALWIVRSSTNVVLSSRNIHGSSLWFNFGIVFLMIGSSVVFQGLGLYDAMNVTLFAALLHTVSSVILAQAAEWRIESLPQKSLVSALAHGAALGVLPSGNFVSTWMLLSVYLVVISQLSMLFSVAFLFSLSVLVWSIFQYVRLILRTSWSDTLPNVQSKILPMDLVFLCVGILGILGLPYAFTAIGASPLVFEGSFFTAGIVAGDSILRPGIILSLLVLGIGIAWFSRNTATEPATLFAGSSRIEEAELATGKFATFRRDIWKLVKQYAVVPLQAWFKKGQLVHDRFVSSSWNPNVAFMIIALIIILVIAL